MSETITEGQETGQETEEGQETEDTETTPTGRSRGRGRGRKADQPTGDQPSENGDQPTGETGDGEAPKKERKSTKASDIEKISLDAINAADLAENLSSLLQKAAAPAHARSEQQVAMDGVAQRAYDAWVKKGRPSAWGKLPVVTYFLDPSEVEHWKYLIRRAVDVIKPVSHTDSDGNTVTAPGVRYKFGNEVTLSEELAAKIDREDAVPGSVVLTWAVMDKRGTAKASENGEDGDGEDAEDGETETETETENGEGQETETETGDGETDTEE